MFKKAKLALALTPLILLSGVSHANSFDKFQERDRGGFVYVMSNSSEANEIMVFNRSRSGKLRHNVFATTATGGRGGNANGPADPLGSQNSLTYDEDSKLLFAVNAGDNTVSVLLPSKFRKKLRVTDLVPSGGAIPVSIAVSEGKVYVLNAGGSGVVTTYRITRKNKLHQLSRIELGLSNNDSIPFNNVMAPGQVGIDPLARHLIVTNAGGQEVLTVDLNNEGIPTGDLVSTPTPGVVPFSFASTRFGSTLVAEAGSGSISSFDIAETSNTLPLITTSAPTSQIAACWVLAHDNGFAYVSNTVSNTLSSFSYNRLGEVTLLESVAGETSAAPTDIAFANDQSFIYSVDAAAGVITGFSVNEKTGKLTHVESEENLPVAQGIQGIASFDF